MKEQAALAHAFDHVARRLDDLPDEWWLIGSAALELHGVPDLAVADIDLLVPDETIARQVIARLGAELLAMKPHPLFQSTLFAHAVCGGLTIEVMAGFALICEGRTEPVVPRTRQLFPRDTGPLYAPSLEEMLEILRRFGRKKDLERIALVENWQKKSL